MKRAIIILIAFTLLTGCEIPSQQTSTGSSCGFTQQFFQGRDCRGEEIQKAMSACEARKTWVDKMHCKQSVPIRDPLDAEINAYISVLIKKVKAHKMTEAQAEYAFRRKVSEVNQQIDQANARSRQLNLIERQQDMEDAQERARQTNQVNQENADRLLNAAKRPAQTAPAPAIPSQTTTHCSPDGYGGVNCTTY